MPFLGQSNAQSTQDKSYDPSTGALRNAPVYSDRSFRVTTPIALIAAPQALVVVAPPGVLTALGPEVNTDGATRISLWLALTWGAMTGIRIACYGKHTAAGTAYSMPIYNPIVTATPYTINIDTEELVLARSADYNLVLTWNIANTIPIVQFGIAATADPAADASVTSAYITYSWGA